MPVLSNPRHERFAQELAKGKTATEAYKIAGYDVGSEKSANEAGSRLSRHVKVQERVVELQERGARRAVITVESLIAELDEAKLLAAEIKNPSAMVSAIREKGILSGKRVERMEQGKPGDFDSMSADELRDYVRREAQELGLGDAASPAVGGEGAAGPTRRPH